RQAIVAMILRQGVRLALMGVAVGIVGAGSAARVLQSLLYQTSAIDPASYAAVAVFVLLVASSAATLPAVRAARVTPMTALRED
ncbi:MAG: ABC transporter permease, partial [Vicinamibacterales bacterium]